jgi:ATP-dependent HslUV protease subunit HslV
VISATTVIAVRRNGKTVIASDGQVTLGGSVVLKHTVRKTRRLSGGQAICGFAGSVADAQALQDRFEAKFDAQNRNLRRAAVEFAKEWRTDRMLRQLDAVMVVADKECLLIVAGDGNVVEPDDGLAGIGSGGPFALAAARAMIRHTDLDAARIAEESLRIAAEICVFTNDRITMETVE